MPIVKSNAHLHGSVFRPRRFAFAGYYGMSNFGDDLFAVMCAWGATTYWGDPLPILICPPLTEVSAAFPLATKVSKRVWQSSTPIGRFTRATATATAALRARTVVFGGGSLFSSSQSSARELLTIAQRWGVTRLAAVGVSIGPFGSRESEIKVTETLKRLDFLAVRDRESYEIASAMGLPGELVEAADLAGAVPYWNNSLVQPSSNKPLLGVALSAIPGGVDGSDRTDLEDTLCTELVRIAKLLAVNVRLFVLNQRPGERDTALAATVRARLLGEGLPVEVYHHGVEGVQGTLSAIGECDGMFSVRLHGAIAAFVLGVPFVLVEYHRKCRDFARTVCQPDAQCIPLERVEPRALGSAVERMLSEKGFAERARRDYAEHAIRNFTRAPWQIGPRTK